MLYTEHTSKTLIVLATLITLSMPYAAAADVGCLSDDANTELTKLEQWYNENHENTTLNLDKPDQEMCARDDATRNIVEEDVNQSITEFENNFYSQELPQVKTDLKKYVDNRTDRMDEFAQALDKFNKLYNQSIRLDDRIDSKAEQEKVSSLEEKVDDMDQRLEKRYLSRDEVNGELSNLNSTWQSKQQDLREKFVKENSDNGFMFGLGTRQVLLIFLIMVGGGWYAAERTTLLQSIKKRGNEGIGRRLGKDLENQLSSGTTEQGDENEEQNGSAEKEN